MRRARFGSYLLLALVLLGFALFLIYPIWLTVAVGFESKDGGFTLHHVLTVLRDPSTRIGLMDRKMGDVLKDITVGSPVERSLVAIKVELDKVNPSVVKNQPIIYKFALFLSRTRLPMGDEILRIIAERRETVGSTINGLKEGLWAERDKVLEDATELMTIADGLKETQSGLQRAIYFG